MGGSYNPPLTLLIRFHGKQMKAILIAFLGGNEITNKMQSLL